jgi:hypothetical protein
MIVSNLQFEPASTEHNYVFAEWKKFTRLDIINGHLPRERFIDRFYLTTATKMVNWVACLLLLMPKSPSKSNRVIKLDYGQIV